MISGIEQETKRMAQQTRPLAAKRASPVLPRVVQRRDMGFAAAVLFTTIVTLLCAPFQSHLSHTAIAFAYLLVVLFVSTLWGVWPGRCAALLSMLCFSFFFLPPLYSFSIFNLENLVTLAAFIITSSTVGHLTASAKQRAAEAEASREEARVAGAYNRSLIETSLDPLVTIGTNGTITDANRATETVTGRTRDQLIGTDFSDYFTEPEKAREGYQQAFREGIVRDYELEVQRDSGAPTPVLYNASVLRDGLGRVSGVFAAARDITERKRAETELLKIDRARRALSYCNKALIRATDESALLEEICRIIVETAQYRLCWVGLAEPGESKAVRPIAHAGHEDGYLQILDVTWADTERGRGPVGTSIRTGETQISKDIATDPNFAPWREEALKRGFASAIVIPLIVDTKLFGALCIYSSEPKSFDAEEVGLLGELAGDLGYGISVLRAREARNRALEEINALNAELEDRVRARTSELQSANRELQLAREREGEIGYRIQQTLLLDSPPSDIPSLRVSALTIPSQRIGGDFYIFLRHGEDCLDVIVGDVMGKGIAGALLGAATKSHILRALSDLVSHSKGGAIPEPQEIVTAAHAQLVSRLIELESFVTLLYARLDVKKRRLTFVDCGHTGILERRAASGQIEILHGDNLPLGFREGEIYEQRSVPLDPGDLLVFFSDGITEAQNTEAQLFGVERLEETVRKHFYAEPQELVESLRDRVFEFAASKQLADDLTVVAVRVEEPPVRLARAELFVESELGTLPRVREFVRTFCRDSHPTAMSDEETGALVLAVDEAMCNVIKHAYHNVPDRQIHIEAEAFPGRASIRVHHLGDSVDLSKVRPPTLDGSRDSGFGIYIIASSVDEVRYFRDTRGQNCVEMVKYCKQEREGKLNGNRG